MASGQPAEEQITSGSEAEELYEPGTESEATDMTESTEDDSEESDGEAFEEALEEVLGQQVTEGETEDEDDATESLLEILEEGSAEPEDEQGTATPRPEPASQEGQLEGQAAEEAQTRTISVTRSQLLALMNRHRSLRTLFRQSGGAGLLGVDLDDDEDEEEDDQAYGRRRRRTTRNRRTSHLYPKIPSEKGQELMESGVFGLNERDAGSYRRQRKLHTRLMKRELGVSTRGAERSSARLISQSLIPNTTDKIINNESRCYSGQFSDDGNFFFSCSQDFAVRMYDTSNPYNWRYYKTVLYPYGQWTITDASLSPDNRFLAYSSIKSTVCLAQTDPEPTQPYLLDFADTGGRLGAGGGRRRGWGHGSFGIWSLRFSGDGREIVAGTSDHSVYVYDLESRQSVLRIPGHHDDVNAVCFGDKSSPHLLYSGSDDGTLKVWDRRSLGDSREAGVFIGHTEGLTYVDSKGDGRYVLSNAKDQTMKLWDLRKMMESDEGNRAASMHYSSGFDYRFQDFNEFEYKPHAHDCSLVTFRGHSVLKTLIRCHFSPPGSTDSRYVYSGSEDGSVWVYNLDATVAGKINVQAATENSRPRTGHEQDDMVGLFEDGGRGGADWKTCVRDASWHPYAPVVAATSWNGYGMSNGTCTTHTWNDGLDNDEGDPPMGQRVDCELNPEPENDEERRGYLGRGLRSRRLMRARGADV